MEEANYLLAIINQEQELRMTIAGAGATAAAGAAAKLVELREQRDSRVSAEGKAVETAVGRLPADGVSVATSTIGPR